MRMHVNSISSISHQLMADGLPCDRYIAFVKVSKRGLTGDGTFTGYLHIYGQTPTALQKQLQRFQTEWVDIDLKTDELYVKNGGRYGKA